MGQSFPLILLDSHPQSTLEERHVRRLFHNGASGMLDPFAKLTALDYRYHGHGPVQGSPNSTIGLEYGEYPLEIQCSTCFLERFKLGVQSR